MVSGDVVRLIEQVDRGELPGPDDATREAITQLAEMGFLVDSREAEDAELEAFFRDLREDAGQLRVTLLTTLQCNFACDYCIQGDHADHNTSAVAAPRQALMKVMVNR